MSAIGAILTAYGAVWKDKLADDQRNNDKIEITSLSKDIGIAQDKFKLQAAENLIAQNEATAKVTAARLFIDLNDVLVDYKIQFQNLPLETTEKKQVQKRFSELGEKLNSAIERFRDIVPQHTDYDKTLNDILASIAILEKQYVVHVEGFEAMTGHASGMRDVSIHKYYGDNRQYHINFAFQLKELHEIFVKSTQRRP